MLDQIQRLLPLESSERSIFLLYLGNFCCPCISHTKTAGFEPGSSPGFKLLWIKLQGLMWFRESKAGVKLGITPGISFPQWTVNGQLRVGFFTTKLVPSGSELTFDYQFQRYGYVPFPGAGIPRSPWFHLVPPPSLSQIIPFPASSCLVID